MKAKEIKDLIEFISQSGLEEVNVETEEFKIKVKKSADVAQQIVEKVVSAPAPAPVASIPSAPAPVTSSAPATGNEDSKYVTIKAPMIGTFYRTPNPDSPPFINVGDTISAGDPACIIEAMKLFNEIESEVSGTVIKILVENAQPVEFDQPLFLVDPS